MYLTYEEYQIMGGTLDETAFEQLEFESRVVIDWWTFNRLQKETIYPEAVKRCIFKLISLIVDKQKSMIVDTQEDSDSEVKHAGIASESNDGVSTSYNVLTAKDAVDAIQKELETSIRFYLTGVKNSSGQLLLYRGLYPNE